MPIKMLKFSIITFLIILSNLAMAQSNPESKNDHFPFNIGEKGAIMVFLSDPPLYPRYKDIFEKYGYSGNGYCWEGHIVQILEKLDPQLLKHLDLDPEAGAFFANAENEKFQLEFVRLLSPIFFSTKMSWSNGSRKQTKQE